MSAKQYSAFLSFLASIRKEEKSIIFGRGYVVLSKRAYESLIDYKHPELKSIQYEEHIMDNWFIKRFLEKNESP